MISKKNLIPWSTEKLWKDCAERHECKELKEGVWPEPTNVLRHRKMKSGRKSTRTLNFSVAVTGARTQKRQLVMDWVTKGVNNVEKKEASITCSMSVQQTPATSSHKKGKKGQGKEDSPWSRVREEQEMDGKIRSINNKQGEAKTLGLKVEDTRKIRLAQWQ